MKQVIDNDPAVFLNVFHIYAGTEMAPWLSEITCPSLVLTSEFDGGCPPRLNEFIAGELKGSELVILNGLRHAILLEAPERVAAPVASFLSKHMIAYTPAGLRDVDVTESIG